MNIVEAAKALKEGKKIRRPNFPNGYYFYSQDSYVRKADHTTTAPNHNFSMNELLADDWEVVVESPMKDAWNNYIFHAKFGSEALKQLAERDFYSGWMAAQSYYILPAKS